MAGILERAPTIKPTYTVISWSAVFMHCDGEASMLAYLRLQTDDGREFGANLKNIGDFKILEVGGRLSDDQLN